VRVRGARMTHAVVVGAGMAAARLADELAARGGAVTLLGDEPHPPYNRILLSAVLEGTHDPDAIALSLHEGVDLRLGSRVVELHTTEREVELADRSRVPYDVLILATGSIATLPPIRGLVRVDGRLHERVHAFRSLDDCLRLDAAVLDANRAVVVGGGLLGLQVTRALSRRGLEIEVVEGGEHLLRSQVDAKAGAILARDLRRLGTSVYTGARATRLTDDGPGVRLSLDNGAVLSDVDLVVLTAGGRPSTALARRAGLDVRRGVVVDSHLRTSDPHIYAIGDCAQHRGQVTGFVPPAWEQAGLLARQLTGAEVSYDGARTVARLRATDLDVAVLGDPERTEGEVVEVTNPLVGSHRKLVVRGGAIVAATLVGDLSRVGLITQHFDRGTVLGPTEPGALLMADRPLEPAHLADDLHDDTEVCACAGVTAGRLRGCASFEQARSTTRATTGCGGCTDTVRALVCETAPLQGTRA
jgi:assimilatory nitrate reductase electron transfer subunit